MRRTRRRKFMAALAGLALVASAAAVARPTAAAAAPPAGAPAPADTATVDPAVRDQVLPPRWRQSDDLAWTTFGDADGFHVLVATSRSGYTWRTAASLAEPGFDTDQWIGNACLTGSGRRLVVVYAPRTFTNQADLFDRGGFAAVVDLNTDVVTKVPVQASLAYFNPGCGAGETAVLTQFSGARADDPATRQLPSRLFTVDTVAGKLSAPILLGSEVSSAVPVGDGVVAAGPNRLVRINRDGTTSRVAAASGVPFRLAADASGGVVYLDRQGERVQVKRVAGTGAVTSLADGGRTELGLRTGTGGRVFLTGRVGHAKLPAGVQIVDAPPSGAVSSTGAIALTSVTAAGGRALDDMKTVPTTAPGVKIAAKVMGTGKVLAFAVRPGATGKAAASGRAPHPALRLASPPGSVPGSPPGSPPGRRANVAGSPTDPVEAERTCAVPRNDPRNQVLQPKPRQVEWAVDQAVTGSLTLIRPANWKNLGMPQYRPQELFPPFELAGGGRVPAQIMLAIITQESNMWQASKYALPGDTGNPLIGNFYGRDGSGNTDEWAINWDNADCGYGLTQVTDGMRTPASTPPGGPAAYDYQVQRAVALDFTVNVAAGLRILQDKWNQTTRAGMTVNNGDPARIENWYFAVWAYNSGFHPDPENGQPWGVGWLNNPINPRYDQQRQPFLDATYDDARNPQYWSYPEKIMGWAGHPINANESPTTTVAGYRAAWWTTEANRTKVAPPMDLFCDISNACFPGSQIPPDDPSVINEPSGPCAHLNDSGHYDLQCWYHEPVQWKGGPGSSCDACGHEVLRFDPGYAYQDDGTSYPPRCDLGGLPAGTLIVDDVPDEVPAVRPNCPRPWANAGSFRLSFAGDAAGAYPSKVDFHQLGGGFGGHFWFGHARTTSDARNAKLAVTGTWALASAVHGWTRIRIHLPDHSAWSRQADYVINLGNGQTRHRVVNQSWQANTWVDLGAFALDGLASVSTSTATLDGTGDDSLAFDAAAFTPTSRPSAFYVAMGDSYASGEGVEPYLPNTDYVHNGDKSACHRSITKAYPYQVTLPGHPSPIAQESGASFAFIACSGASTTSITNDAIDNPVTDDDRNGHTIWGEASHKWGEVPQVDQGYLDADTTLVTLSVGGNDVRFAETLRGCIVVNPLHGCYADGYRLTRDNGVVDPVQLKDYAADLIRSRLPRHLRATYRAVHAKAPNAKIIVVGYPQLFADAPNDNCVVPDSTTQLFLNGLGSLLTITIAQAVDAVHAEGVDITFVDPTPTWRGGAASVGHLGCAGVPDEWTNMLINWSQTGSGRDTPGVGSYHPKASGHAQVATLVNTALRGSSSVQQVADRLSTYVATRSGNAWANLTDAQAQAAAAACLDEARRAGVVGDPCMTLPVLFPTATNAAGAAHNDAAAIAANPAWAMLNYASDDEKAVVLPDRSWYERASYGQTSCPTPRPNQMQCDEYPFYSSLQGGAWDVFRDETSPLSTRLILIPDTENRAEGSLLGAMYSKCAMTSVAYPTETIPLLSNGSPYLTVPVLDDAYGHNTFYVC